MCEGCIPAGGAFGHRFCSVLISFKAMQGRGCSQAQRPRRIFEPGGEPLLCRARPWSGRRLTEIPEFLPPR